MLEYKVYYDNSGNIITYTTEKLEGNYLVITWQEYIECRFDAKIINSKLVKLNPKKTISKFTKSSSGTKCSSYDINILVDDDDDGYIYWDLVVHEL